MIKMFSNRILPYFFLNKPNMATLYQQEENSFHMQILTKFNKGNLCFVRRIKRNISFSFLEKPRYIYLSNALFISNYRKQFDMLLSNKHKTNVKRKNSYLNKISFTFMKQTRMTTSISSEAFEEKNKKLKNES